MAPIGAGVTSPVAGDGVWEPARDIAPVSRPQPRGGGRGPTEGEKGHGDPEQVARRSPHVARRAARLRRTPGGRASCVLPLRAPPRAPAHLSVRSRRAWGRDEG